MFYFYQILCFLFFCIICYAQDSPTSSAGGTGVPILLEGSARLLISKFMLSNYAVEGKDFIVDYNIYNIGDKPAVKVQLIDDSFPTTEFEVIRGLLAVKWERIAPGANVSHSAVIRPKNYGYYNFTWAEITYLPTEDATEQRKAYSSAVGETYIYRLKDFERKFSPHLLDWALFAMMTLPSLAMPSFLWYKTKSKYSNPSDMRKKA